MKAWSRLAPPGRFPLTTSTKTLRPAAVAVLLFPFQNMVHTIFLQRSLNDGDRHSGQISFPGGKVDPEDLTLVDTALRELKEETNIQLSTLELVAHLTPLPVPVSGFEVHPFIFSINYTPQVILQETEAVNYFFIDLQKLKDPANYRTKDFEAGSGLIIRNVPYFNVGTPAPLWGATAMITEEMLHWIDEVLLRRRTM